MASLFALAPLAASADEQDPAVARISVIDGGVDVKRADSGDTVAAAINAPLNAGDYLTTQDDARAELQLDDLTELRVAPDTQLRFTNMSASSNTLQLAQGTVELRLFRGNAANPEVDTPSASVRPTESGAYRVTVDNEGNAIVTVRSGTATVATQNDSQTISAGTSVEVAGDANGARLQSIDTVADDDFDAFNEDRDHHEADAQSYNYVNDQFVGADDLDQYGSWQNVDGYGEVWHPHYASGWAPYQDGSWTWEPYYGWTWVSAEPWGWAPYHYGRWFYAADDGGWCWTPATQYFRPVYQPAQVAFFSFGIGGGIGGGIGIGIGFGNVGWVALGPTDPFRPWWGGGRGFGGRGYGGNTTIVDNTTNITNITTINNYRNINAPGGIVAVRNTSFAQGDFRQHVKVTPEQLRTAQITPVRGILPIVPTAHNLAYNAAKPVVAERALSPRFSRFKPLATTVAPKPFDEQRAEVSTLAARTYPTEAKTFERDAAPLPETAAKGSEPETAEKTGSQERNPVQDDTKVASPWDRFDQRQSGEPAKAQVTTTHADGASPDRNNVESTRPSYAQPDPAEKDGGRAAASTDRGAPAASPERTANSPWNRFDSQGHATQNGTADHAAAHAGYEQHSASAPSYSVKSTTPRYEADPAVREAPVERTAPVVHSDPAYHAAPAYHSDPAYHAAPAYRASPAYHAAPAYHAPAYRAAPAVHSEAAHTAASHPARSDSAPAGHASEKADTGHKDSNH